MIKLENDVKKQGKQTKNTEEKERKRKKQIYNVYYVKTRLSPLSPFLSNRPLTKNLSGSAAALDYCLVHQYH